jgi:hypothetical protein
MPLPALLAARFLKKTLKFLSRTTCDFADYIDCSGQERWGVLIWADEKGDCPFHQATFDPPRLLLLLA